MVSIPLFPFELKIPVHMLPIHVCFLSLLNSYIYSQFLVWRLTFVSSIANHLQNFPSQCAVDCLFISVILFAILSMYKYILFFCFCQQVATYQLLIVIFFEIVIFIRQLIVRCGTNLNNIQIQSHVNCLKSINFDIFRISLNLFHFP